MSQGDKVIVTDGLEFKVSAVYRITITRTATCKKKDFHALEQRGENMVSLAMYCSIPYRMQSLPRSTGSMILTASFISKTQTAEECNQS